MSLRLQINLIVSVLTLLFALGTLGLELRGVRQSVNEEVVAANNVATQLLNRTVWRYAAQGTGAMVAFLQGVGRVRANDITLLDKQGQVLYQSPPSVYKAGRNAPAWFERLVAPAPSEQAITFPDGQLLMRANASRAVLDAWDDVSALALIEVALIVTVNALVFWVVGRAARPLGQIVRALRQLQGGRFDVRLPPLPGKEAAAIGSAFNQMAGALQEHIETERRAVRAEDALSDSRDLNRWVDQRMAQERLQMARQLHDELGQSVTAMRSMALSIAQRMGEADSEVKQAAGLIAQESSKVYDAIHGMIPKLTPLVLDHLGLADALNDLAQHTRAGHPGLVFDISLDVQGAALPTDTALTLYRAAREGVSNALQHGQATHLQLTLLGHRPASGKHEWVLHLVDNGVGLAPDWSMREGHYGLRWMSACVEGLGGHLRLVPGEAGGAQLHVTLPMEST